MSVDIDDFVKKQKRAVEMRATIGRIAQLRKLDQNYNIPSDKAAHSPMIVMIE